MVKDISKLCFSERNMEQTVEIAVPCERVQQWEEAEVPEIIIVSDAVDGTSVDLDDKGVDVPEKTAELVSLVSQERVQQRTAEVQFTENLHQERISERTLIVDVPVPKVAKDTVEAVRVVQRERTQQRTVDAPTLQEVKETVEMVRSDSHERVQQRDAEQIEDAPQSSKETVEMASSVSHENECNNTLPNRSSSCGGIG